MKEYHEVANEQYQSLSSLISKRKKECDKLSKLIDDEYNSLVELYENQIISDLKKRLRSSGISFDEYVFRYNRMFARYHCLYEEDSKSDYYHDYYGNTIACYVTSEEFKGFFFYVNKRAVDAVTDSFPELVMYRFNTGESCSCGGLIPYNNHECYNSGFVFGEEHKESQKTFFKPKKTEETL
jgi:hypothetical protein